MFVPIAEPMSVNVLTGKEVIALRPDSANSAVS
jgi:hypothetical protein